MPSTIYLHRIDPEPAGLIETHGLVGDDLVVEPLARVLFNPSNVLACANLVGSYSMFGRILCIKLRCLLIQLER